MKLDPNLIRVRIEGLPAAIPDDAVREKLAKFGVVDENRTERERIRMGRGRAFRQAPGSIS